MNGAWQYQSYGDDNLARVGNVQLQQCSQYDSKQPVEQALFGHKPSLFHILDNLIKL